MGANRERPTRTDDQPMITVSELARVVRLSRASIQYYEKIGVLNPDRTDAHHRYPVTDCYRLTNTITLRNLGVSMKDIPTLLDDEPFSAQHMEAYRRSLDARKEYLDAQATMLDLFMRLSDRSESLLEVRAVEPHYFKPNVPWSSETGTADAGSEPMYMPISGTGARFEGTDALHPTRVCIGRTVPVRFARLITGFDETNETMGGCDCLTGVWETNLSSFLPSDGSDWTALFARFDAYLGSHRLRACGNAFVPYGLVTFGLPRVLVCLPVRRVGLLARMKGLAKSGRIGKTANPARRSA